MNWLGGMLVVFGSLVFGSVISREEGKKFLILESLISLLKYTERRIQSQRTPLFQVFASFEDDFLEEIGFLEKIRSCRNGLPLLWKEAVELLPFRGELEKELLCFGEDLGNLSLSEQIGKLEICVAFLESQRDGLRESLPKKQKSLKTVCCLFGLLTAIILL